MQFQNTKKVNDRTYTFTLSPIHVSYANTLRRLVLTGVETVAFRADMTSTGTTTDVVVKKNDTPMTNEMLAHRIGLLPINITNPLKWNPDKFIFKLEASSDKDSGKYVKSSDFEVREVVENEDEPVIVSTSQFFPPNSITNDTCLIATLQAGAGPTQQNIEIIAKATIGTGRENARFIPVSQCSYEYTRDEDPIRRQELFDKWLVTTKMISENLDKESEKYKTLLREFNTMEVARCYLKNEKDEPYSFDFTVESVGVLSVPYIVQRACEVGENMCNRYVNIDKGDLPEEVSISSSNSKLIGYDFLIRNNDHTLGNLLQTWLVEHHVDGTAEPKISYAGYAVPHPLRDEMLLRIGVEDGDENTARKAFANAARGCAEMFRKMRESWMRANGLSTPQPVTTSIRRRTPKVGVLPTITKS
jgi:DNA-directed RNA polymerase subunit L/DNA-directed RNA polymerase alpha subunit